MSETLLEVLNLSVNIYTSRGVAKVVDNVSFDIKSGEALGLVGESGCGKTMTALSILKLLPPNAEITSGSIKLEGDEIVTKSEKEMRLIRGRKIGMIFQDPNSSLNPVMKIGDQLIETITELREESRAKAKRIAVDLLNTVGVPNPELRLNQYPFQLSGGLRQRVMIALALAGEPSLLIADEPTTNLDVTVQWQILNILRSIKEKMGMSILIITHNLGIVAFLCDRVAIMYAGKIVEFSDVFSLFDSPLHPYTQLLINCIPPLNIKKEKLAVIEGEVPDLFGPPSGCKFHPRCPFTIDKCKKTDPPLIKKGFNQEVRCIKYGLDYDKSTT